MMSLIRGDTDVDKRDPRKLSDGGRACYDGYKRRNGTKTHIPKFRSWSG